MGVIYQNGKPVEHLTHRQMKKRRRNKKTVEQVMDRMTENKKERGWYSPV